MGESSNENSNKEEANGNPNFVAEALHNFTSCFPKNVGNYFKPF
ncbi:hypothetical protein OROMI_007342 [Orobanche minor]